MYKKTVTDLTNELNKRITEGEAELTALKGVQINTKHKTLTNRAISGEGARIGDYIGIGKALFVSYAVKYPDGHTKYEKSDLTAYTYNNPDGTEICSNYGLRTSRTMTPAELADKLKDLIENRASAIGDLRADLRAADTLVHEYNAICDTVNEFENKLTWASRSVLKIG